MSANDGDRDWGRQRPGPTASMPDRPVGDLGRAEISPGRDLQVGSTINLSLSFTVGRLGIRQGGRVQFTFPSNWTGPQVKHEAAPGYVRARDGQGTPLTVLVDTQPMEHYILVESPREMLPGEQFTVEWSRVRLQQYPRTWWGCPSGQVMDLDVLVDCDGSGIYAVLPEEAMFTLRLVARPAKTFFVVAPSMVRVGEPFDLKIVANDEFRNPAYPFFEGEVFLAASREGATFPRHLRFGREDRSRLVLEGLKLEAEGTYRIHVTDKTETVLGESNPIVCQPVGPRAEALFWGDIHIHSGLSDDALGTPDSPADCFAFSRDYACLDFAAVTDHIHTERIRDKRIWQRTADSPFAVLHLPAEEWGWLREEDWAKIQQEAARFNQPGAFVTFLAFEMEEPFGGVGHRNVYMLADRQPLFPPSADPTIEDLWAYLEDKDALVIPHHSLLLMGWRSHNPRFEKVAEVYSSWGSSEYKGNTLWTVPRVDFAIPGQARGGMSVQEMLAAGARLGLVGSGDNHSQGPGRSPDLGRFPLNITHRVGLAAVYAPALSREQIFGALGRRRCYATTGERIVLDFRLNEALMGEELQLAEGTARRAEVAVLGTGPIDTIEILRDNAVVCCHPAGHQEERVAFEDREQLSEGVHYYYVRVTQSDGNMAWSSPIWVSRLGSSGE